MRIADYIALADRIKERFDVAALSVGGVAVWPFVRLMLFFAHEHKHLPALQGRLSNEPYRTPLDSLAAGLGGSSVDWRAARAGPSVALLDRRKDPAPPDILVMQDPNDYLMPSADGLTEPLYAGARELLGERYRINGLVAFHPALAASGLRGEPERLLYVATMRRPLIAEADLTRFMGKLVEIARFANSETGEATIVPSDALCWLQRMMGFVPAFTEALDRIRPRVLMLQSSLGLEKLALVIAAKRARVPVVDHQHGIFRAGSTLYIDWIGASSGAVDPTPDVFWLWSDYFERIMPESRGRPRKVVGGDLRWRPAHRAGSALDLPPAERRILTLEQGPTLAYHMRRDSPFPEPVIEAMRLAPAGWQWLVRLHPRMLGSVGAFVEEMRQRGADNVLVELPSAAPLDACLSASDAVLTGFSAGAIEAHDAGLPVVLFEPIARDLFREPIAAGAMHAAEDPAAIVAALGNAARHRRPPLIARDKRLALAAMEEILGLADEQQPEGTCRPAAI